MRATYHTKRLRDLVESSQRTGRIFPEYPCLAVHVEAKYAQTSPDFAYFFVPLSVSSVLNPVCLDLSAPQVETRIWREKQGCFFMFRFYVAFRFPVNHCMHNAL